MTPWLILPMAAHVLLAAALYVLLTVVRAPAVWGVGRRPDGSNPWAALERRVSANLSNQFEWPLFFHVACVLLMLAGRPASAPALPAADPLALGLAWVFVAGRLAHSAVQVGTTNVRLRGLVFTINFVAVLGLWARLLVLALAQVPASPLPPLPPLP